MNKNAKRLRMTSEALLRLDAVRGAEPPPEPPAPEYTGHNTTCYSVAPQSCVHTCNHTDWCI